MESLHKARYHAWFHHNQADGWVTVARNENGTFKQYHYQAEELASNLAEWLGEDVYFSQNTFYKPYRKIENIRQLRALYVDVDCHLLNYDPSWVIGKLDLDFFKKSLPDPNLIIFSGRGLVLVWFIDPAPYQALPLWQSIQNYFLKQLQSLGGDAKATDASRVFRIAGSVNSKNGAEVNVQYRHDYRYSLREIQEEYLPDLKEKQKKQGRKSKIVQLHNIYRLHYSRLHDLVKLVELRNHDIKGQRELTCFLYRYWSCCLLEDEKEALEQTLELNAAFLEPLSEREVIRATKSAEKAWKARSDQKANEIAIKKGFPGAGYNIKNSKLIDWLRITPWEQQHLSTIIDGVEKRRRKRERDKLAFREKHGSVSREEYEASRQADKQHMLTMMLKLIERNPKAKQKELAELLGVDRSYISKLRKELKM